MVVLRGATGLDGLMYSQAHVNPKNQVRSIQAWGKHGLRTKAIREKRCAPKPEGGALENGPSQGPFEGEPDAKCLARLGLKRTEHFPSKGKAKPLKDARGFPKQGESGWSLVKVAKRCLSSRWEEAKGMGAKRLQLA